MEGFIFIILLLAGLALYIFPPKKVNSIYGYRTPRTMKDQKNWDYGQKMSGKLMIISAFVYLALGYLLSLLLTYFQILPNQERSFKMLLIFILVIIILIVSELKMEQFEKKNSISD